MNNELKACPFCGQKPVLEGRKLKHITKRCMIGDLELIFHCQEQAIEAWNRRYDFAGQHETLVIFDTPEKAEEGALLLARIRQISQDQLLSEQVKRMNELIKATGFQLHRRK